MRLIVSCLCLFLTLGMAQVITRGQWGARAPRHVTPLRGQPVQYAIIHHSAGSRCFTEDSCKSQVRNFQNHHMDIKGWSDIGYNFIIGGDGSVFEGRGWDRVGSHARDYNSNGLGFCLVGDFTDVAPSRAQISSLQELLRWGTSNGKLSPTYTLKGHRDVGSTQCPGNRLYNEIRTFPRYSQAA